VCVCVCVCVASLSLPSIALSHRAWCTGVFPCLVYIGGPVYSGGSQLYGRKRKEWEKRKLVERGQLEEKAHRVPFKMQQGMRKKQLERSEKHKERVRLGDSDHPASVCFCLCGTIAACTALRSLALRFPLHSKPSSWSTPFTLAPFTHTDVLSLTLPLFPLLLLLLLLPTHSLPQELATGMFVTPKIKKRKYRDRQEGLRGSVGTFSGGTLHVPRKEIARVQRTAKGKGKRKR
jgi:hypothetical protein